MVMLFAGAQKDDPTKLHAIMEFSDLEALQAFGANEELTEERRQAGAVIESGVMTIMAEDEFLTSFPAPRLLLTNQSSQSSIQDYSYEWILQYMQC